MARRNVHLFKPANRFQLLAREAVLRLAARPFLATIVKRSGWARRDRRAGGGAMASGHAARVRRAPSAVGRHPRAVLRSAPPQDPRRQIVEWRCALGPLQQQPERHAFGDEGRVRHRDAHAEQSVGVRLGGGGSVVTIECVHRSLRPPLVSPAEAGLSVCMRRWTAQA